MSPASDHAVLIGWGEATIKLGQGLQANGIEVVMTTLNPGGAEQAESAGIPVVRGDAMHPHVLAEAGIRNARLVVIAEDTSEQIQRRGRVPGHRRGRATHPPTRLLLASFGYDLVLATHEERMATWRAWEKASRSADPA